MVADLKNKWVVTPTVSGVRKPKYPLTCRRRGHEGVTVVEVIIDEKGECMDIKIVKSAGCSRLDKSAMKA